MIELWQLQMTSIESVCLIAKAVLMPVLFFPYTGFFLLSFSTLYLADVFVLQNKRYIY